jgi:hypothetical protein
MGRQLGLRNTPFRKLFPQKLAGVDYVFQHNASKSVVIDNFNVQCVIILRSEANAVLVVDPDAVLAASVSLEFLQAKALPINQILQRGCIIEEHELSIGGIVQDRRKFFSGSL